MVTFLDVTGLQRVSDSPDVLFVLLFVSNAIMAAAILYQMKREHLGSYLSISAVSYFALHAAFCLLYFRHGEPSSYSAYKSALSLSFIAVILILRFLEERMNAFQDAVSDMRRSGMAGPNAILRTRGFVTAVLLAACFTANVYASAKRVREFIEQPSVSIGRKHDVLTSFASSPYYNESDFIIGVESIFDQWFVEYYAPVDRTYVTGFSGVNHDAVGPLSKDSFKPGDIYITVTDAEKFNNTTDARPVMANGTYSIFRMNRDSLLVYGCGGMSVKTDVKLTPDGAPVLARRVTDRKASLLIRTLKDKATNLNMTFFRESGNMAGDAKIYVNGIFASSFRSAGRSIEISMDDIALREGINEISFELEGDISEVFALGPNLR
jgi:hypothetical protein